MSDLVGLYRFVDPTDCGHEGCIEAARSEAMYHGMEPLGQFVEVPYCIAHESLGDTKRVCKRFSYGMTKCDLSGRAFVEVTDAAR